MKIAYKHLVRNIQDKPSIEELSEKLFQLGHEHEIEDQIFDIDITPNRGDCLSMNGIIRELSIFFKLDDRFETYKNDIDELKLNFENKSIEICPKISFLKIEINDVAETYEDYFESYFEDLSNNKVNFFTDISNYLSYELGQPIHCYDYEKMNGKISLEKSNNNFIFETLLNQKIDLKFQDSNYLFYLDNNPINLAGVIGGKSTACSKETKTVLVECAFFEPEAIIGKATKYDIQSDASYKFERGVDYDCHNLVLRRFIKIVEDHADISSLALNTFTYKDIPSKQIPFDHEKIDTIIGYKTSADQKKKNLNKLGFSCENNIINIPRYRNDINHLNDIAEEIARIIGYDNITPKKFSIHNNAYLKRENIEHKLKSFLVNSGFCEVINFPFTHIQGNDSVLLDNPLDSNKPYMRTTLKDSLIENLLYNERRQKDSIKIFEISDLYFSKRSSKKVLGLIGSGRLGKNYRDFSKKIDLNFFQELIGQLKLREPVKIQEINRNLLNSKIKSPLFYLEIDIANIQKETFKSISQDIFSDKKFVKYNEISEFPSTFRDISFSVKDPSVINELGGLFKKIENKNVKDVFVFDFYENKKLGTIKIGYRIIFQSFDKTLTDNEVDNFMENIIADSLKLENIEIPGLTK